MTLEIALQICPFICSCS